MLSEMFRFGLPCKFSEMASQENKVALDGWMDKKIDMSEWSLKAESWN